MTEPTHSRTSARCRSASTPPLTMEDVPVDVDRWVVEPDIVLDDDTEVTLTHATLSWWTTGRGSAVGACHGTRIDRGRQEKAGRRGPMVERAERGG